MVGQDYLNEKQKQSEYSEDKPILFELYEYYNLNWQDCGRRWEERRAGCKKAGDWLYVVSEKRVQRPSFHIKPEGYADTHDFLMH